ncbi:hypothetical protein [Vallitalea okinawensis]|uniref:hypothetical protein n=1 Tax=Vallitalea okinawensis TaxID=2078660 RepID=UPI000CFE1087|nr:hypothetical protein [Vallitalea okinawensis]
MCDVFRKIHRNDYIISSSTEEYHQQPFNPLPKKQQPIIHQLLESAASMELAMAKLLDAECKTLEMLIKNFTESTSSDMAINNVSCESDLDDILKSIQLLYSAAQMEADFSNISEDESKKIELLLKSLEDTDESVSTVNDIKEISANLKEIIIAITSIEHDILQKIKAVLALSHL